MVQSWWEKERALDDVGHEMGAHSRKGSRVRRGSHLHAKQVATQMEAVCGHSERPRPLDVPN